MHTDIKVGLSCNNKCIHCIMQPIKSRAEADNIFIDAPLAEILSLLDQAHRNGFKSITLTGGEITLRDDLTDMVLHANTLGLQITIQTNGRLLSKINLQPLHQIAASINFVIALHGASAIIHDTITREKGSFTETVQGIESVLSQNFKVIGKIVLSCVNLSDVPGTLKLLTRLGVKEVLISFPHAEDFAEETFKQVVPRYSELRPILDGIYEHADISSMRIDLETIPYCQITDVKRWRHSSDLSTRLQELNSSGDSIIKMPMINETINWTLTRKEIKAKNDSCKYCLLDHLCEGVWAEYAERFGTSELVPITDDSVIENFINNLGTI